MHIRCTEKELCELSIWFDTQAVLKNMLPKGTTCLVESEIDEKDEDTYPEALFTYEWDGTGWQVLRDHKEHTRKATKEELESANNLTKKQVIQHMMLTPPEGLGSPPYWKQEVYSDAFYRLFPDMWEDGYWPETNQNALRVKIEKNSNLEQLEADILEWLPYYKAIKNELNDLGNDTTYMAKTFGIFEHTCSEHGSYQFHILSRNDFKITKTTYGRTKIQAEFKSLKKALKYIQDNHWYGDE